MGKDILDPVNHFHLIIERTYTSTRTILSVVYTVNEMLGAWLLNRLQLKERIAPMKKEIWNFLQQAGFF